MGMRMLNQVNVGFLIGKTPWASFAGSLKIATD
jgi:hypothetical protein